MKDENCIFCKILAGEIPSTAVYEDDDFKAILDVNPAARGHVIILPKNHAANIYELPDEDASKYHGSSEKLLPRPLKKLTIAMASIFCRITERRQARRYFTLHVHVIHRDLREIQSNTGWKHREICRKIWMRSAKKSRHSCR